MEKKPLSRKSKKAVVSLIITVLVITAVILVNAIAMALTEKYTVFTADITALKAFELTEQSKNIAENVDKKVTITFLSERKDYENRDPYCKQTSVIANEMAKLSNGMITVEYADIVTNPTLAQSYTEEDNITANDVVVSSGDKRKILKVSDLFTFEAYTSDYQYISSSQSEQVIDNAIVTVTSDIVTKTAVVMDSPIQEIPYFINTLQSNNYDITEISLEKDELSKDIQMLVIYEPERDFSDEALLKLEAFIKNDDNYGKSIVYIPDINGGEHPKWDSFISMFGMMVEGGVAFEYDSSCRYYENDYYEYIFCDFASNLYRKNLSGEKYTPVMTGLSRPIRITNDMAEPLLVLSEKSGIVPYTADDTWSMADAVTGNVCVLAQSFAGDDKHKSSFVIIGSADMISSSYFINGLGNQNYFMTMLAELNGRSSEMINVADKVITSFDISADAHARFWIGFIMYAVIPLMILGCGLTVYLVRRGK